MSVIKSRQNSLVKHVRALDNKRYRDERGQFFIEGTKMVEEAIREDGDIDCLLVADTFDWQGFKGDIGLEDERYDLIALEDSLFSYMAKTKTPQGIAAILNRTHYDIDEILHDQNYFLTILDGVQDPGNVGTIIRTMDCAGGNGVILLDGCSDPYSPKALRATMGSIFRIPTYEVKDDRELFLQLIAKETHVMISHLEGENLFSWRGGHDRTALIIGNEGRGVRGELLEYASSLIKIPMLGGAESLNASVASGIIIYQIVREQMLK